MTQKLALIVDDSKLARIKLGKRLEEYGLAVDSADSAEDALAYLQFRKPDIIFMDHTMPGMDGLQALKIIKEDPQTAMIPVVMYTSQEGEVYVGQARALGAMGVLPKQIQATDLANILERLHLTGAAGKDAHAAPATEAPVRELESSAAGGSGASQVTPHPALRAGAGSESARRAGLVEEIRAELRRQITLARQPLAEDLESVRQQLARMQRRHDEMFETLRREAHEQRQALQGIEALLQEQETRRGTSRNMRAAILALMLSALLAGTLLLGHYWQSETERIRLVQRITLQDEEIARLRDRVRERDQFMDALASPPTPQAAPETAQLAQTLVWGFNQGGAIPFGSKALDDDRARRLEELLDRLEAAGFSGTVRLDLHFGRFCTDASGGLAPPETPFRECNPPAPGMEDVYLPVNQESMAFARLLDTHPALRSGQIQVEIRSHGTRAPLVPYPEQAATAGEWNRIAEKNHRVVASLRGTQT